MPASYLLKTFNGLMWAQLPSDTLLILIYLLANPTLLSIPPTKTSPVYGSFTPLFIVITRFGLYVLGFMRIELPASKGPSIIPAFSAFDANR